MREIQTDYLVIGAGASGMSFVDTLLSLSPDARVVLVDREDRPGGHWLHAYPFVQLHQPSANYGVPSRRLGEDRIDTDGINAGFYERATAPEITSYFGEVLDQLVATGRVTFLARSDYQGKDGEAHAVVALDTGDVTRVRATKLVDATFVASDIPSRHTPGFEVDGARLVPPNALVDLGDEPTGYTVLGAGKTASDTCTWLLDQGVDPDRIRWVKPREPWMFDRVFMQPLELVASYMKMQAHWVKAAAETTGGHDFAERLAAEGVLVRTDPDVPADMFRGATISQRELAALRTVDNVVRKGKVRQVARDRLVLEQGEIASGPGELYVDCTAHGVPDTDDRPVFADDTITLGYVTFGITPYSAATVAAVEASRKDDADKNRLTPPLIWTGRTADVLGMVRSGMAGLTARMGEPDLNAWNESCRLNPAMGALAKGADPEIAAAFGTIMTEVGPAFRNLDRLAAGSG